VVTAMLPKGIFRSVLVLQDRKNILWRITGNLLISNILLRKRKTFMRLLNIIHWIRLLGGNLE
jgi:hypothetical protein